ncbi:MAG TPA: hypothetical protein VHL77_00640 [Ferruginibacter sp.]|jgi:hypothetical protein|nr:hypothetical protein [Ferruginibacter sp.]
MKKLIPLLFAAIVLTLISCEKEYSVENGTADSDLIVGLDCRISKIVYADTAGTGTGLGSIKADINSIDVVTMITRFDSLSNTIEFIGTPTYTNDSVYINPDEYFVVDANKRIKQLHGLQDPTDPFSLQFDVFYQYTPSGQLVAKNYFLSMAPTIQVYRVDYTYSGGNLTRMTRTNLATGDFEMDADLEYYNNIVPKRYLYIFPDEVAYAPYTQFFNFGTRPYNAIKKMTVRNYDPGNVVRDSLVSNFSNYIMSRDTYVLHVQMGGDAQPSIPAVAGKLSFSYRCR